MAGRTSGGAAAMRRPSKQKPNDKYTIDQVIAALKATGGIKTLAAQKLGCDPSTVHGYINRYWEIGEAVAQVAESVLDLAEAKLLKHIKGGNLTAIIFYLKTQGKQRGWVERVEATGKDGAPIEMMKSKAASVRGELARRLARMSGGDGAAAT
jgi:hypothetical protein